MGCSGAQVKMDSISSALPVSDNTTQPGGATLKQLDLRRGMDRLGLHAILEREPRWGMNQTGMWFAPMPGSRRGDRAPGQPPRQLLFNHQPFNINLLPVALPSLSGMEYPVHHRHHYQCQEGG